VAVQPVDERGADQGHAGAAADLAGEVNRRGCRSQVTRFCGVLHDQDHDLQEQADPQA
jgi:hypothetical protein